MRRHGIDRRTFLHSAFGLGCTLPALAQPGAADPPTGRVLFGFFPDSAVTPVLTAMLKALQGHYTPDLGTRLNYLPGNAGALAIEAAHKGLRDGSTVLLMPSSVMTLLSHLRKLPTADPAADFVPVAALGEATVALAVGPAVPAQVTSVAAYLRWVYDNPAQTHYAVPGLGTSAHYTGMALARFGDVPLRPVAYRSFVSLAEDLSVGNVPAAMTVLSSAAEAARDPRVRLLAVASDQRWPGQPDLPTFRELSISNVAAVESWGFFVPTGTTAAQVGALDRAVRQAAASADVRAFMAAAHLRPMAAGGPDYASHIARERATWGEVIRRQRFSLES